MGWRAGAWTGKPPLSHSCNRNVPRALKGPVLWWGYSPCAQGAHRPSAPPPSKIQKAVGSGGALQLPGEHLIRVGGSDSHLSRDRQVGGKKREENSIKCGWTCSCLGALEAGKGAEKAGSLLTGRNCAQKAMQPLTELNWEMKMVRLVF